MNCRLRLLIVLLAFPTALRAETNQPLIARVLQAADKNHDGEEHDHTGDPMNARCKF